MKLLYECLKSISNCERILLLRGIQSELDHPYSDDDYDDKFFVWNVAENYPFDIPFKSLGCITTASANYIQKNLGKLSIYPIFCYQIHVNDRAARLRNYLESNADTIGRIIFIDNDLGNEVTTIDNKYVILNPNKYGYDVLCYTVMGKNVAKSASWTYAYFGESWQNLKYSEINSKFAFWEAIGVLLPTEDNLLFRFSLNVS